MLDIALKLLEEITSCGFQAYIVGGFVRDHILGIDSNDIDINTNATPKEIKDIFDRCLPNEDYGSVTVIKKGVRFEITTFRKEMNYLDNPAAVATASTNSTFFIIKITSLFLLSTCYAYI